VKPRLLDLFCCAGGAAKGYQKAGFYVVGVDIKPQPHYCGDEFHQADALTYPLEGFDAYHASPPCQGYSIMKNLPWVKCKTHPLLIPQVRELLKATGKPYVIENVMGAKLDAGWLCGQMFGLPFYSHRAFETNFAWLAPGHPNHRIVIERGRMLGRRGDKRYSNYTLDWMNQAELSQAIPPAGHPNHRIVIERGRMLGRRGDKRYSNYTLDWMNQAELSQAIPPAGHPNHRIVIERGRMLGRRGDKRYSNYTLDWMNQAELSQAIPPAYTEFIGKYLLAEVLARQVTK